MMRHILGEDLNVGCVLSWGPCWYFQKQYFDGTVHRLSTDRYLMRYDVEVSGFPSQHAGPPLPAAAEGGRLHLSAAGGVQLEFPQRERPLQGDQDDADRRVAHLGPADPQVGQGARGRGRLLAQRLGPEGRRRQAAHLRDAAVRRHRRQRVHRRRGARRVRLHLRRSIRPASGS